MSMESITTKALGDNAKEQMYTALQTIVKDYPYLYSNFLLDGSKIFISEGRFVLGYEARVSTERKDYFNIELEMWKNARGKSCFVVTVNTSILERSTETGKLEQKGYKPQYYNFDSEGLHQAVGKVIEYLNEHDIDIARAEGNKFNFGYILSSIKNTVLRTTQGVELNTFNESIYPTDANYDKIKGMGGKVVTVYGGLGNASDMGDLVSKEFSIDLVTCGSSAFATQRKTTVRREDYPLNDFPDLQPMNLGDIHNLIANEFIKSGNITFAEKTGSVCLTDFVLNGVSHGLLGLKDSQTLITLARDNNKFRLASEVVYAPEELGGQVLKLRAEVYNDEKMVVVNTVVENKQTGAVATNEPIKYSFKQMNSEMNAGILRQALGENVPVKHLLSKPTASKRMITNFLNTIAKQSETLVTSGLGVIYITCSVTKCNGRLPFNLEKHLKEDGYVADITIRGVHRNSQFSVKLMLSATKTKGIYYVSEVVSPQVSAELELSHFNVYYELNDALQETLEAILGL